MQENKPILIVGLGNPGRQYDQTRHNVGFMAVSHLAGENATWQHRGNALICVDNVGGRRVIYACPQTFMNLSGDSVAPLMRFYKIPLENLIVIHDDMDLQVGDIRTKVGGGSAGHNGIKSIDAAVGRDYRRIRIGIGHPRNSETPQMSPADWVLGRFSDIELTAINKTIETIKLF